MKYHYRNQKTVWNTLSKNFKYFPLIMRENFLPRNHVFSVELSVAVNNDTAPFSLEEHSVFHYPGPHVLAPNRSNVFHLKPF